MVESKDRPFFVPPERLKPQTPEPTILPMIPLKRRRLRTARRYSREDIPGIRPERPLKRVV